MRTRSISNSLMTGSRGIVQVGSSNEPSAGSFATSPRASDPFDDPPVPPLRLSFPQPPLMAGAVFVGPTRRWRAVAILHPDGRVLAVGHERRRRDLRSLWVRWRQRPRASPER